MSKIEFEHTMSKYCAYVDQYRRFIAMTDGSNIPWPNHHMDQFQKSALYVLTEIMGTDHPLKRDLIVEGVSMPWFQTPSIDHLCHIQAWSQRVLQYMGEVYGMPYYDIAMVQYADRLHALHRLPGSDFDAQIEACRVCLGHTATAHGIMGFADVSHERMTEHIDALVFARETHRSLINL